MTGPMIQGANSSSPTPLSSLFDFLPEATATISSKICRPTAAARALEDHAAVDVHVLFHVAYMSELVASLIEARLAAEDGAAARREANEVAAAGDQTGDRHRVVAGVSMKTKPRVVMARHT